MISLGLTDGTTTISLTSSGCMLVKYVPTGPAFSLEQGWQDVTESVELVISSSTVEGVQEKLSQLERLLRMARIWQGARVFLTFKAHASEQEFRSEIHSYRILVDADAATSLPQKLLGVQLVLTRSWWWEGPRTQIPLSNRNGSSVLTPLKVLNHTDSDAGNDNFADIASTSITGSVPAPLELKLVNNSGASRFYWHFYVANSLAPTSSHIVQGEEIVSGYGTVTSYSGCSGGAVVERTSLAAGERLRFQWHLSSALVNLLRGAYIRVLGKMSFIGRSGVRTRLALLDTYGLLEYSSTESALNTSDSKVIQDFGVLQIPSPSRGTNWVGHRLELSIFAQEVDEIYSIDFLQFTPAKSGQSRILTQWGYSTPVGDGVVDNGIENLTYYEDSSLVRWPLLRASGDPLQVWPGMAQRLLFLHDANVDWSLGVQAWYRPRRTVL